MNLSTNQNNEILFDFVNCDVIMNEKEEECTVVVLTKINTFLHLNNDNSTKNKCQSSLKKLKEILNELILIDKHLYPC